MTTRIRAARSRRTLRAPRSAQRCRRNAGGWCGPIPRTAVARSISPRMPMRSKAWKQRWGQKLIDELMQAATAPGTSYLHQWREGDVVMWDNRATMHRGRPWPAHEPRLMVRTTISATAADGVDTMRLRRPRRPRNSGCLDLTETSMRCRSCRDRIVVNGVILFKHPYSARRHAQPSVDKPASRPKRCRNPKNRNRAHHESCQSTRKRTARRSGWISWPAASSPRATSRS